MLFTLPLDTWSSVASFLVVIHQSYQMSSSACWTNVWVTAVIGWPEQSASPSSTWPFSEPAIRGAQWLTMLLQTASTLYTYFNCMWVFVTDSFSGKRNLVTTHCLKHTSPYHAILMTPAYAWENILFRGTAVPSASSELTS